jgi:hypothetical protein
MSPSTLDERAHAASRALLAAAVERESDPGVLPLPRRLHARVLAVAAVLIVTLGIGALLVARHDPSKVSIAGPSKTIVSSVLPGASGIIVGARVWPYRNSPEVNGRHDWSADVQTERATVRLTSHITGGAEVGDFLYVVTTPIPGVSTKLVRIDANGHVLSRDLLVGLPSPVAFARGSVWIGDRGRNSVLRVDLASLKTAEAKLFAPANPSFATPVAPDGTPGPVASLPVSPTRLAAVSDPIVAGKTADGRRHLLSIDAAGRSAREIFSSDNEFAIAPDSRGTLFVLDGSQLFAWKPLRGGSWNMPGARSCPTGCGGRPMLVPTRTACGSATAARSGDSIRRRTPSRERKVDADVTAWDLSPAGKVVVLEAQKGVVVELG